MNRRRPRKTSHLAATLIEHSSDAITLVDENGTALYANPATARILGLPLTDVVGFNVFQSVHEEDIQAFKSSFSQAVEQPGVPIKAEFRLRRQDGTYRHVESVAVNRLHDASIRGVIVNYRDVTEAMLAQEALRESEARYRRLAQEATDIIYNCDLNGRFTYVNPTATRLMKFTEGELIGRHFLTLIRSDYRQRAGDFYERQVKDNIRSTYFEFPAVTKDGGEIWFGQSVQIIEEHGAPVGVQAIARDITSRLALEEQLRRAQKMEAIGRLAGGVAHDFNNVLTAILGASDLLGMMLDREDPRWAEADAIKRAAERGAGLTKRLLSFSRPERGAAAIVDAVSVVSSMEPVLRRLVPDNITIAVDASQRPISVRADESALSQILLNLVINARDAMADGGTITIVLNSVELRDPNATRLGVPPGAYAVIAVRDTGHGIAPEVHRHLFEPFFTTKPADQGTGLGLSIVYGVVKGLKGGIEVQSEPGHGAVFTIYLPLTAGLPGGRHQPGSAGLPPSR